MKYQLSLMSTALSIILLLQSVNAQEKDTTETMSLAKIWELASTYNQQLKLQGLRQVAARLAVIEAKDRYLPTLSLTGDFKLNTKFLLYPNGLFSTAQDVPVQTYGYGLGYNLNLNLYNGGLDKGNVKIKEEEQLASHFAYELQHSNIKYLAAIAYYELYKLMEFNNFIASEITAERRQLTIIENLYKNGIVLKSDVLRIAVKLDNLELSQSEVLKKMDVNKQKLNVLMGREEMKSLRITAQENLSASQHTGCSYPDYVDLAAQQSPEFKILESAVKTSELQVKQVKSGTLPKLFLYSNYSYSYPQISFYPYSTDLWGFGQTGLKMQWSIDNAIKSKHTVAQAKLYNDEQRAILQVKREEVNLKIREIFLQHQQAAQRVATAEKNIAQSTEAVRVIKNSYLNQESLLTDLLEAENMLLEAKFKRITALVELKLNSIQLQAITGTL